MEPTELNLMQKYLERALCHKREVPTDCFLDFHFNVHGINEILDCAGHRAQGIKKPPTDRDDYLNLLGSKIRH